MGNGKSIGYFVSAWLMRMRHFEACQALEGVHVEVRWDHVVEDHGRGPVSRGPSHTGSRSALRYPVKKTVKVTDRKWGVNQ